MSYGNEPIDINKVKWPTKEEGLLDLRTIFPNMTVAIEEIEALSKAYDYIAQTREVQGRFLTVKQLYGDGTRFMPLSLKGFEIVLNEVKSRVGE